jgi:hypothetical protein
MPSSAEMMSTGKVFVMNREISYNIFNSVGRNDKVT